MFRRKKKNKSTAGKNTLAPDSSAAAVAVSATSPAAGAPLASHGEGRGGGGGGGGSGPASASRQSVHRTRSKSAPPSSTRRHQHHDLIEDHYRFDHEAHVVLPGVPKYDDDWARDCHDFFNLIALVPVCVLNAMNWNFDILVAYCGLAGGVHGGGSDGRGHGGGGGSSGASIGIAAAWTGEWFLPFFQITALYFTVDLLWVALVPKCVKSPATIIQHHIATICYIMIPFYFPFVRWLMGACMSVEVNTWCLIARRVFNKQGLPPWILNLPLGVSIRIKLISILFYTSWILIRIVLYPVIWAVLFGMWKDYTVEVGTGWNVLAIALPLHSIFCALNIKWSVDLLLSKYWRKGGKEKIDKGL